VKQERERGRKSNSERETKINNGLLSNCSWRERLAFEREKAKQEFELRMKELEIRLMDQKKKE
jgi:hypothetical protein